jgi:hypothetical protein
MSKAEVIVGIAAEGGSITLYGWKDERGRWQFSRDVDDHTPTLLDDNDGGGPAIKHSSTRVGSWEQALGLLDRYPWAMLAGIEVHAEFRERVWAAITARLMAQTSRRTERAKARWADACGVTLVRPRQGTQ